MTTLPLIKLDCHLMDTSSIMAFSGADFANPDRFADYREEIWLHIESMISKDKLKTVSQVWPELEYNDPKSYARLMPIHDKFILPTDDQTDFRIINLISKYPKLIDHRLSFTREPADPYLIVYAQKLAVPIISDEKSLKQRVGTRKNRRLMIPDVCSNEKIVCKPLEEYLKDEGIIPKSYHT